MFSLLGVAIALAGCSAGPAPASSEQVGQVESVARTEEAVTTTTITIGLPPGGTLKNTVLSATGTLLIDSRAVVGASGQTLAVANFGTTTTQIAAGAVVNGNVNSTAAVFLGSQAVINGNLQSASAVTAQAASKVTGATIQNTPFGQTPFSWTVTLPSTNAGPVTLQNGASQSLAPGSYGALTAFSGTTLSLRAGTYFFTSFDSEPGSTVKLDESTGPVLIYDTGTATLRGTWVPSGGANSANMLFVSLGTGVVDVASTLFGTIVAPTGTVNLDRVSANDIGQVFAKQIELFSNETILAGGFDWSFFCPLGDTDGDGVFDCTDQCPLDPNKTAPGVCGCGVSETDSDHDGFPDCIDQCPGDSTKTSAGQCGCSGSPGPAGTPCNDGICSGVTGTASTCDGAGKCGSPSACAPDPSCVAKEWNGFVYWICPGPATWAQAQAKCDAVANQSLLEIDSREENAVLADLVGNASWMGANDQATIGTWAWAIGANAAGNVFFTGGATVAGSFSNWTGTAPGDNAGRCGSFAGHPGTWSDTNCGTSLGYVCKRALDGFVPPTPPPVTCGQFGGLACPPSPAASCVPSDPNFADQATWTSQVNACLAANCNAPGAAGCSQCLGAAAVPPPGSTCSAYTGTACGVQPGTETNTCVSNADCTAGQICGVTVASGPGTTTTACSVCDNVANGGPIGNTGAACTNPNQCGNQVTHCGTPEPGCEPAYDGGLCRETVLCAPDGSTGIVDPRLNPGSDLNPTTFDPTKVFTPGPDAGATYPADPACPSPPCSLGPSNGWCTYLVPTQLPPQDPTHSNPGKSGSGGVLQFDFDPNLSLHYDSSPLALGETKFDLSASASLTAGASFNIPLVGSGSFDILDALAQLTADRCEASSANSHLKVFGVDFLPSQFKFDTNPSVLDADACNAALNAYETTVDRAKKAMKDAEALLTQYNANKAAGQVFGFAGAAADAGITNLCQQIAASPPAGFPPGNCANETPEATINRFVSFYTSQVKNAFQAELQLGVNELTVKKDIPLNLFNNSEEQTLFEATFFIGPIPCLLQVQSVENYGIQGDLNFSFNPGSLLLSQARENMADITGQAAPYASAGISLFVGVGFDIGVASASAGVEGLVTLGQISAPITAGAGLDIAPQPDTRPLPADLSPLAGAIPIIQPEQYQFFLDYHYGAEVDINKILAGYLAARLEVSFLFWSASWTAEIVDFGNGFSLPPLVLLSGNGSTPALGSFPWATVQMPTPFVSLNPLPVPPAPITTAPDGGAAKVVNFDTSQVEKLFYDSLCTCVEPGAPDAGKSTCFRNQDCCEPDGGAGGGPGAPIVCFADPALGGLKSCEACRQSGQTIAIPCDAGPFGCFQVIPPQSCNVTADCCQGPFGTQCLPNDAGPGGVCIDNSINPPVN